MQLLLFLSFLVPAAVFLLLHAMPVRAQEIPADLLEARIEAFRREWRIPGLSLVIVRGDSALVRGFGVRRIGSNDPADGQTLFAIGSTTKAFTSAAAALLVGEGRLGWDDPVVEHLPGFTLYDPWVTREITLRDLLAHRSGLPMANPMWQGGQLDADELLERLRHLKPMTGFRETFTYQNVLYLAAGRIIAEAAGTTWAEFVGRRLFSPLGMTRSRTGPRGVEGVANVASPHVIFEGEVIPVPYREIEAVGPAGSILSSAADMARWLRFQLGEGEIAGLRLVDAEALLETRRPQTVIRREGPLELFYPEAHRLEYGMGWIVSDYRGLQVLDHAGGIDGMTSLVAFVPEADLGIALLTNLQTPTPPYGLLYDLLDVLLGHEPVDRTNQFRELGVAVEGMIATVPPRAHGTRPALPPDGYEGSYASELLGAARVMVEDGRLVFRLGSFVGALEHWHHDTFRAEWTDRAWRSGAGAGWITFRLGRDGTIRDLELALLPGEAWTFERVP
jgi:CubicO group peptidase (beta-lactamase class C family)